MGRRVSSLDQVAAGVERDVGSAYDNVKKVADNLGAVNSVADAVSNVNAVGASISNVNAVVADIDSVNTVGANIADVSSVNANIVPNLAEILDADTNAATATTKAGEAATSASNAAQSEADAEEWANSPEGTLVSSGAGGNQVDDYSARHHAAKAKDSETHASEWANAAEDTLVSAAAGGDQVNDYSALHWANKAAADAASIQRGLPNGVASLDANGLVPASELPSYVDDVLEYASYAALPVTGAAGKIYVVIADETDNGNTNTFRWTGTVYVRITDALDPAEAKTIYESNADTNAFTDQEKARVADFVPHGVESSADANLITANADPTKYDVAAFDYYISGTKYSFAGQTGISAGFIAGDSFLIVGVNASGLVFFPKNTFPSPSDLDATLEIGGMATTNGSTIAIIGQGHFTFPDVMKNISQWSKFVKQTNFIGPAGSISESTTPRQIDVAGGDISDEHFHIQTIAGAADIGMVAYYRVAGTYELQAPVTPFVVSNTQYDNGTNLATLSNNKWASHNIARSSRTGTYYFIYSEGEFASEADAIDAPFSLGGFAGQIGSAVEPLAKIIIQKGSANVNQVIDVRNNNTSVISASTSTMQTTYDRSSVPHIVLSNGNTIEYRNDVGDLNDTLHRWANNAGTTSYLEVGKNGINVGGDLLVAGKELQPSLVLDFATGNGKDEKPCVTRYQSNGIQKLDGFDNIVTFTRASAGSYYDANGVLKLAASGEPRFDHDPVTLEQKGLLIEEARTNDATKVNSSSGGYYTPWREINTSSLRASRTAGDGVVAPDGTLATEVFTANPSATAFGLRAGGTTGGVAGTTYSGAVWLRASEPLQVQMQVNDAGTIAVNVPSDEWVRAETSGSQASQVWKFIDIEVPAGTEYDKLAAGAKLYAWGTQLETGAFPTSYIPTTDTFTSRASTGTYYDASGIIQTAAIDVERAANYYPGDLTVLPSPLYEEARTNLILHSEDFTSTWTDTGPDITITANATTAPDGTTTADKLTRNAGLPNDGFTLHQITSYTTGLDYTLSVFFKPDTETKVSLRFPSSFGVSFAGVVFDTADESFSVIGSETVRKGYIALPNGWYRVWVSATCNSTSSLQTRVYIGDDSNLVSAAGTEAGFFWGAQVEQGSSPSSYIPTTTVAVTRSADVYSSVATTRAADSAVVNSLTPWHNTKELSVQVEVEPTGRRATATGNLVRLWDGVGADAVGVREGAVIGGADVFIKQDDVLTADALSWTGFAAGVSAKLALSLKDNLMLFVAEGTLVDTDTSTGVSQGITQMQIMSSTNGHIKQLKYYPFAMTQAQLEAITS